MNDWKAERVVVVTMATMTKRSSLLGDGDWKKVITFFAEKIG